MLECNSDTELTVIVSLKTHKFTPSKDLTLNILIGKFTKQTFVFDFAEVAEGFVCPDPSDVDQPGLYSRHAHPTDCRKFYVCIEGTARPYGCSLGTVFNVDTLQCDEPENVPGW